ncbi:MAG: DUF4430 domain-containing protein [Clostridiales bacterium]|nr:DUF4430 domain-containing protein [Clostridiales bacterium]
MKKHKNKILIAAIAFAVLAGAWIYGGNYPDQGGQPQAADTAFSSTASMQEVPGQELPKQEAPEQEAPKQEAPGQEAPKQEMPKQELEDAVLPFVDETAELPAVEPGDAADGDGSFLVTLTVRCDTILGNMNMLNKEKRELVPSDGVIFNTTTVTAYEGESVFNISQRTMKQAKIHMAFRNTPVYNSAYIEAIGNLYEFDVGELSGWMYCVNEWYPSCGCSSYKLRPGDAVEWNYTCDLGRDLGQFWVDRWQADEE